MAQSLTKSSASLVAAGGNLAEAAALTATANAIIQDADSVGTALKTTSLRLRGTSVKVLEEDGLDTDGAVESTSKLRSQVLATSGVDILTDTGAYKSTYQILLEIAEVWDQITDDKARAGLLELLAGKRNSSVIAALLQNPEDLKAAYEDAMDAEGSALKENERYLDSIQGKIDQFNNAMQAMWSDTLDSDVIKWFVGLGTELVKIVDTIGLIPSVLASILTYKLAIGAAKLFHLGDLMTYIGLMWTAKDVTELQGWALDAINIKQALMNSTLVKAQAARMGLTAAELAGYSVTQLLGLGIKGLIAGFKNLWIAMGPVGWAIVGITVALTAGIAIFNAINKTTEELKEELDDLKSELSDIRSELDSVNSELETTNERMAELLAKDKLTFEEQEELDRLRATNDELERRKALLEDEEKNKSGLVGRQAARVVDSKKGDKDWWESSWIWGSSLSQHFFNTEGEEVENNISDYKDIKNKLDNASSLKEQEKYQKKLDKEAEKIDAYIAELSEALDGVEYGDSEESDKALDYLAELQDNYGIARGSASAETNAIKGVFNKPEFEEMSKAINYYVEALKDGDENAATFIEDIINNNEDLVADLEARGVDADKAIEYWTKLGSELNFSTIEGKTEEIKNATAKLPEAFNNIGQFIDDDKVDTTAIAEYFKGTSAKTREEIAKLIQDINDGKIDVDNALKMFELFGVQSVVEIEISEVQTNFKDAFTDLENADGLIDTFQELADAIGSTSKAMDALNAAQAEMDYSGRVSIETALKLMESTDDYSKVLTISNGKLILAENAEENLIDARLEGMKASALKALEEAKAARETTVLARSTAETALSTYNSAIESEMAAAVTATAWDKVLAAAAGLWAGIKSLFTDESWTEAYDRAYQETLNSLGGDRTAEVKAKYATAEEQAKKAQLEKDIENADKAIAEQDKEIEKLQGNYDLVSGLNKDNIGDVFKSDDLDGPEDVASKLLDDLQKKYERQISNLDNQQQHIQNQIDILEAKDQAVSTSYYEEQIKLEQEKIDLYEQEREELKKLEMTDDVAAALWETEHAIQESTLRMIEFRKSIVDLYDEAFNKVNEAYGNQEDFLQDQQDFIEKYAELNEEYAGSAIKANIGIEEDKLEDSQNKLDALREAFRIASTDGYTDEDGNFVPYLEEGGEAWVEMQSEIRAAEAAVLDNKLAIKQYKEELADLAADKFSNVVSAYDEKDALNSDRQSYIESRMSLDGTTDSQRKSGYRELIELENNKMGDNINKLGKLIELRDQYVKDGTIEYGSEQWLDMTKSIREAEKAILDNQTAIGEYHQDLKQLEVDAFNNIRDAFSQMDDFYSNQQDYVEGYISHLEALGIGVPEKAYEGLIDIEKKKRTNNLADLVDARQGLKDLEAQGFDVASDEWKDAYASIVALEKKIQDSDIAMAQWNKTIRDMEFERFDTFIGRIDDVNGKLENLYDLTSKEDVATEEGEWTDSGLTSLGLLYQQMTNAQVKADEYAEKITELNNAYQNGEMSEGEYYDRLKQLEDGQWDAIDAYESAKEAMVDMEEARIDLIEEGINKEIEAYEELIDLKKEELDAERDLYDFKKNVQKQSKDIASLERRIASLSGSTNASDIAERRKLEAELYEAQEGLNDTYYDHSKDQQGKALDDEMEAFRTAKEEYIESLRETLDNMGEVVNGLITTVLDHSETVLTGMESTASVHGITLSGSLTGPWTNASGSVTDFKNAVDTNIAGIKTTIENSTAPLTGELGLPWNNLTAEDGPISTFSSDVNEAITTAKQNAIDNRDEMQKNLEDPYDKGTEAANTFGEAAKQAVDDATNKASNSATSLTSNLTQPWKDAEEAANTFSGTVSGILEKWAEKAETEAARVKAATDVTYPDYTGNGGGGDGDEKEVEDTPGSVADAATTETAYVYLETSIGQFSASGTGAKPIDAYISAKDNVIQAAYNAHKKKGYSDLVLEKLVKAWEKNVTSAKPKSTSNTRQNLMYAKGTTGTTRDQWAITDEPQFGDELVLVPGKDGNLSFMRKGTGVVPADMTQKLFELAQIPTSDLMNKNLTAIVPNITKNDFKNEFSFESLVHVDTVDSDTLPKLEKMVDKKIDDFSKALNYSLKRFAR